MSHFTTADFWSSFEELAPDVQQIAREKYELLKNNPRHPSLHLKKVGRYWSARVNDDYRAVAIEGPDGLIWFWIGFHRDYDRIIK